MSRKIFLPLLMVISIMVASFSTPAHAEMAQFSSVRRNIATIIFCGLGGAVLGLSTLSFYGQPQEHISNITTGFAIGIVAGTVVVTSQQLNTNQQQTALFFHDKGAESLARLKPMTTPMKWSWTF